MADATRDIPGVDATCGPASVLLFPEQTLKTGVTIYQSAAVFRDPADSALLKTAPSGNPMYEPWGVAMTKAVGDGVLRPNVSFGPHVFDNAAAGNAIPATLPLGWPVYAQTNRCASLTNGAGLYPRLGWFGGMTGESTPRPIVWVGFCPFALRELLIPVVLGHADLTAAATTQAFTLYTLPGPARVMHPPCNDTLTDFSGGGTGSATLQIGAAADADAIGAAKDIFTGADPGVYTAGVLGYPGALLAAGTAITATVTADTTVAAYTAGAVVAHIRLRPGS